MTSKVHAKSEKTYYVTARTVNSYNGGYGLMRSATISTNKPDVSAFKDREFQCAMFKDKKIARLYMNNANRLGEWFYDSFIPGYFLYENGNKEYTTILGASILPKLLANPNAKFRFESFAAPATIKV